MTIGIRFPFKETNQGGIFMPTRINADAIRSNIIALLTLRRGQRPMDNNLYSPLYDFIFEQYDDVLEDEIKKATKKKLAEYIPEISVDQIPLAFDEATNVLEIKIVYRIVDLGIKDSATVSIKFEDQ